MKLSSAVEEQVLLFTLTGFQCYAKPWFGTMQMSMWDLWACAHVPRLLPPFCHRIARIGLVLFSNSRLAVVSYDVQGTSNQSLQTNLKCCVQMSWLAMILSLCVLRWAALEDEGEEQQEEKRTKASSQASSQKVKLCLASLLNRDRTSKGDFLDHLWH